MSPRRIADTGQPDTREPDSEDLFLLPTEPHRRTRRRLVGAGVLLALLLVLALTPPLVNVNRFRHRIAESMSQSLGRPVHLDNVRLHLLPMPGITLQNLVVSEDPAFGSEPTIRADTVEVTVRPSSLWRWQVEFSTVRFVAPSLNLVRNAEGRWNLQDLLVHAAHVTTAPTAQAKAGPAPRFPYIEATGGRVNLKLGQEKTPFSLTEADFALWLPSPQQWRVRLVAKPARTDSNVSDPGTVRLEGTLERADSMAAVPVHLQGSWHDAPLGEASRLLSGADAGWRGTLQVDASLDGTLGAARLHLQPHLVDLRRADFVPLTSLDIDSDCNAVADTGTVTLSSVGCSIPVPGSQPMLIESPAIDLQRPLRSAGTAEAKAVPLNWLLDWLRLFSTRTPGTAHPRGAVDLTLARSEAAAWSPARSAAWSGTATLTLPPLPTAGSPASTASPSASPGAPGKAGASSAAPALRWTAITVPAGGLDLQLAPVSVPLGPAAQVTLSGDVTAGGYDFRADGLASPAGIATATRYVPQLTEDLEAAVPGWRGGGKLPQRIPQRITVLCSRAWGGPQTCSAAPPAPAPRKKRLRRRR